MPSIRSQLFERTRNKQTGFYGVVFHKPRQEPTPSTEQKGQKRQKRQDGWYEVKVGCNFHVGGAHDLDAACRMHDKAEFVAGPCLNNYPKNHEETTVTLRKAVAVRSLHRSEQQRDSALCASLNSKIESIEEELKLFKENLSSVLSRMETRKQQFVSNLTHIARILER